MRCWDVARDGMKFKRQRGVEELAATPVVTSGRSMGSSGIDTQKKIDSASGCGEGLVQWRSMQTRVACGMTKKREENGRSQR